jgi:hypothetical protein
MNAIRGRIVPVLIGAVVVVGAANLTAYAANGHPLLLGHANRETHTAVVNNLGRGPALGLETSKESPPLQVSSSKVVKNLNADAVDGQQAASLMTSATEFHIPGDGVTTAYKLVGLKPGHYIFTANFGLAATSTGAFCLLENPNTGNLYLASIPGSGAGGSTYAVTGSSTIAWGGGAQPLTLACIGGALFQSSPGTLQNTFSFTRIAKLTKATATSSKTGPRAHGSAGH